MRNRIELKKNRLARISLLSVSFFVAVIVLIGCGKNKKTETPAPILSPTVEVKNHEIKKKGDNYKLEIDYPSVGNRLVDTTTRNFAENEIDSFRAAIGTERLSHNWINELTMKYDAMFRPDSLLGFKFEIYTFTGGAHGNTRVVTMNFDLKNNRRLALSDLFAIGAVFLDTLSAISREDLKKQLGEYGQDDWIAKGAGPEPENFQRFLIGPDSLYFYFEQYTVAPYAAGVQKVSIPLVRLKKFLNESFLKD
ncbi:hypothetical protein TRIP_C10058 [Candidatus Zixiibacteriota bacterium]|nr:hypothetical protein TRIP_C10058 [candidate division Zixibacteria bacterium]